MNFSMKIYFIKIVMENQTFSTTYITHSLPDCYAPDFCDFLSNFRKNTEISVYLFSQGWVLYFLLEFFLKFVFFIGLDFIFGLFLKLICFNLDTSWKKLIFAHNLEFFFWKKWTLFGFYIFTNNFFSNL